MSVRTLPLLFINLGGEMLYIIDQRLRAQRIETDKSSKVLNDIVGTMFNKKFIEELFNPQEVYNKRSLHCLFEKLAHASIMRLNSASMDKLYDLMMMAFKYQVLMCQVPSDILLITLNHLDAIRKFVSSPGTVHQVEFVYDLLIKNYKDFSVADFQYVRHSLLNFFQGLHIRVSIFLKSNVQKPNGHFIVPTGGKLPYGMCSPGVIRIYDSNQKIKSEETFSTGFKVVSEKRRSSISLGGDHITTLGTNMYVDGDASKCLLLGIDRPNQEQSNSTTQETEMKFSQRRGSDSPAGAQNELALLAQLLGNAQTTSQPSSLFTLNLIGQKGDDDDDGCVPKDTSGNIIQIDASRVQPNSELSSIMEDLEIQGDPSSQCRNAEPDLLDLMDS